MTEATLTTAKTPWHLWLVGIVAVLFNAVGAFDYVMSKTQGEAYMAGAGMTPEQIAFMMDYPVWMNVVWPIGVWGAFAASVLILLRKKLAVPVFLISTVAWFVSLLYTYILTNGGEIWGQSMHIVSVVITVLLLFFTWYAREMTKRGVLT
ncbi:MAG: hypothetical protein AB7E79_00155 [Rhodospirillaceae bacterium]